MKQLLNSIPALLIGSTAAKFWWPKFRDPADCDVYCSDKALVRELKGAGINVQTATIDNGIAGFIDEAKMCPVTETSGFSLPVANPILLLTIKAIHINYPRKFAKNIRDYIVLRQLVISNPVQSLIDARMSFLDKLTKIERTLQAPAGFWESDMAGKCTMLGTNSLKTWCIYSVDDKFRQYVQDHYCELLNEKDRIASRASLVSNV